MRVEDLRIGDRFANKQCAGFVLEVLADGILHKEVVFRNDDNFTNYMIGFVSTWGGICDKYTWEYLGNFAKSKNFSNLYDLLSEC